jgi:hypothetical protein
MLFGSDNSHISVNNMGSNVVGAPWFDPALPSVIGTKIREAHALSAEYRS